MRAISSAQSLPPLSSLSVNGLIPPGGPRPGNGPRPPAGLMPELVTSPEAVPQETSTEGDEELREVFTEFVGQTLFGSMLASMRKTVGKPAYMHGGRTEEVFQQQLDQLIVQDMTKASADSLAGPMFDLFSLQRSQ